MLNASTDSSLTVWAWTAPLILLTVMVSAGAFRAMHTFVLHHASHGDFGRHSPLIGVLAGAIGMTQSYDDYRRDHLVHHSALTSRLDPDQAALAALGLRPGLPRCAYPRLLCRTLLAPACVLRTVSGRVGINVSLRRQPLRTTAFLVAQFGPVAAMCWWYGTEYWKPLVAWSVAWLLPLTLGWHVSMVLYALGLHSWFRDSSRSGWEGFAEKTGARFFADPCPARSLRGPRALRAWCFWWFRLLFWHLLVARVLVVGFTDNGCHDAHHADPKGRTFNWCDAAYARSEMMANSPRAQENFWHTWSLSEAITRNFDQLADLPRATGT
ncbi:hypothetical protein [Streptomyces violaceorubidus]|uniref:hypothetical protein n=1 Tax=Streptomyces violaceorubidus TaxID=284042 RepID=UPI0004C120A7|nr:hypothetical protein [Streptomyces violaceorubidus]